MKQVGSRKTSVNLLISENTEVAVNLGALTACLVAQEEDSGMGNSETTSNVGHQHQYCPFVGSVLLMDDTSDTLDIVEEVVVFCLSNFCLGDEPWEV